jgi:acylphosphatase
MPIPDTPLLSSPRRIHLWISGRVQGVGYRAATADKAMGVGVNGWVRNLPDGRVEAVFEGSSSQVDSMLCWCYQGSPASVVQSISHQEEAPEGLQSFEIRPTPKGF